MTDVQIQYKYKRATINAEIVELKKRLSGHAKKQKANGKDWGYVGDLSRVDRLLREVLVVI